MAPVTAALLLLSGLPVAAGDVVRAAEVAAATTEPMADVQALFAAAEAAGRVGTARKSRPVEARPAAAGEVVVTVIAGEGEETRSPPARPGDMVVRNRCHEAGSGADDEAILVSGAKFPARYEGPLGPGSEPGWQAYRPTGVVMRYFILSESEGSFRFTAPWGEAMVARPGDAIVRDPEDPSDTYRIAAAPFACTYEILEAPRTR